MRRHPRRAISPTAPARRAQLARLGALTVTDLERQAAALREELAALREQMQAERDQQAATLQREAAETHSRAERELQQLTQQRAEAEAELTELRREVVTTREEALLQEVGVYQYTHPLSDAVAYQAELARLQDQQKAMAKKDGGAVTATTNWTVNGSAAQGRAMVRDFSKLLLRAYNAEADTLVRSLKPYKVAASVERLTKVATTIARLGKSMDIRISDTYHRLRVRELELTADYLAKVAEEKERERDEKARLEKERQHYLNARQALLDKGDTEGAARLQETLKDIAKAIDDVDFRAANIRAGYVYVISNIGAFGGAAPEAPRTNGLYSQSVRYLGRWLTDRGREPVLDELTRYLVAAWLPETAEPRPSARSCAACAGSTGGSLSPWTPTAAWNSGWRCRHAPRCCARRCVDRWRNVRPPQRAEGGHGFAGTGLSSSRVWVRALHRTVCAGGHVPPDTEEPWPARASATWSC
jgi:hypothetical protein